MQNADSFRELVENPTEVLPLDLAVSLIAGVANDSVHATDIVTALDDLASQCKASNACELMTFLFGSGKFAGNTINFDEAENSLFDRVLERRLGIPISLGVGRCASASNVAWQCAQRQYVLDSITAKVVSCRCAHTLQGGSAATESE